MNDYISYALVALTSFFTLINPLGTMPVFMTMTGELDSKTRFKTARKAVIVSFFTLLAFAFSGELLFNFFGISVNALRVVGGIIFFLMGQDMLQARLAKTKVNESDVKSYVNDISVTPLAIPMICGPGAITNAIILMEDAQDTAMQFILIGVIAVILSLTLLILWSSSKVMVWLGDTGNKVLMRLMGLIVMVIAVEFFFSGLTPIIQDIFNISPAS
jgi:multiple antibiotic resistance protein